MVLSADGGEIDGTAQSVYDSVRLLAAKRDVLVRGPTLVEDVERIDAVTTRHGVSFTRYVPYTSFVASGWLPLVATIGFAIDSALDLQGIGPAVFDQQLDDNDLLTNGIEFVVSIPPPSPSVGGPFSTRVFVAMQTIADGLDWFTALFQAQDLLRAQFPA